MQTDRLVDAEAVADRFTVAVSTVNRWVRERRIPFVRPSRRVVRFDLDQVDAALRSDITVHTSRSTEVAADA